MRTFKDEDFDEELCGKCKHEAKDGDDFVCNNPDSECYGCCVNYRDCCADFEGKNERRVSEWDRLRRK